jgi:hypothetical protein
MCVDLDPVEHGCRRTTVPGVDIDHTVVAQHLQSTFHEEPLAHIPDEVPQAPVGVLRQKIAPDQNFSIWKSSFLG